MASHRTIIPIMAAQPARGCTGCLQAASGPVCHSALGEPCGAPVLQGPGPQVQRLLDALSQSLGLPVEGDQNRIVRALAVIDGEVELQLAVNPRCGGAELAEAAFQTLRRLLPDTDIYVTHKP